jgi:hypothetical protein
MTKDQIWELVEIHNLLASTETADQHYGFNLLTGFIEKYGFQIAE